MGIEVIDINPTDDPSIAIAIGFGHASLLVECECGQNLSRLVAEWLALLGCVDLR